MHAWWLLAMSAFVATLWMGTSDQQMPEKQRTLLLAGQSASVLAMAFLMGGMHAGNYLGFLLLTITWQLALSVPMQVALPWVLGQAIVLALAYVLADHADWTTAAVSVIFKSFTYIVVLTLKRESDAKAVYAALNVEMLATREMLAERSRANERLRISRDLHDVLGHRLTALSLNLEIAMNKATLEDGRGEIQLAQSTAKKLLQEVRDVVSTMRSTDRVDLCEAMHELADGFAPLEVNLNVPPQLRSCDAGRAEVLIRCAQELITNAVKHAAARQVWIELELNGENVLSIRSHDDGNGAMTAVSHSGVGLKAMQERFENFGGRIQVCTDSEAGFRMTGFLPMQTMGEAVA
jgi:signal transduction histidine kinase